MFLGSVGLAGELRCIITRADGTIKKDTGYQKNLILNQGLEFFGGGFGNTINQSCVVGSGNSTPIITQTKLDAFVALASGINATSDYSYANKGDNLYRMWEQKMYRFTGLSNVNISEVGLVSTGSASSNYYLTTRALIKDSLGSPTTISIKTGETLDIYYKIHKIVDTTDKTYVINLLDGDGGSVPYNTIIRPSEVGSKSQRELSYTANKNTYSPSAYSGNIGVIEGVPTNPIFSPTLTFKPYTPYSFKIGFSLDAKISDVGNLRSISTLTPFLHFQMRLGRVSDDAPLVKTNKETLSMPFEFSWGRYEGVL